MSTENSVRDELVGLLRYANKTAIARELGVSAQAVINWSEGRNATEGRLEQVRRLYGLDTTKEAPPAEADGAMREFMRRWEEGPAPRWANELAAQIVAGVKSMNGHSEELHSEAEALREIRMALGRVARAQAAGRPISPHDLAALGIEATPESRPEESASRSRRGGGQGR